MPRIEIFFSYAHEDEALMDDVRRQLIVYDRQEIITKWHDRQILPGQRWKGIIDQRLHRARIILLLVSPHFIQSRYCYDVEMAEALRRHEAGEAVVIPIILRPCPWSDTPLAGLQALPKDGRALTQWPDRDEVTLDVAKEIMRVVREMSGIGSVPKSALRVGGPEDRRESKSIEDKWCNLDYIEQAGIGAQLRGDGYRLTWALAENVAGLVDLEGWEEVVLEDKQGDLVRFKVRDPSREYLLLLRKPTSAA